MSHVRNPDVEYMPTHRDFASVTMAVFVSCSCGWFAEIDPNPNKWDTAAIGWYLNQHAGEAWIEHVRGIDAGEDQ